MGLTIVVAIILSIPRQNNRFYELVDKQSFEKIDINNSTNVRFHIFNASIQAIPDVKVEISPKIFEYQFIMTINVNEHLIKIFPIKLLHISDSLSFSS